MRPRSTTHCWDSDHDGQEEDSGCGNIAKLGLPDEGRVPSDGRGTVPCCDPPSRCKDRCPSSPSRAPASKMWELYAASTTSSTPPRSCRSILLLHWATGHLGGSHAVIGGAHCPVPIHFKYRGVRATAQLGVSKQHILDD